MPGKMMDKKEKGKEKEDAPAKKAGFMRFSKGTPTKTRKVKSY